ncbi:hypothetical protein C3U54_23365 [Salmonella enterica]|nr:hypothetical protein [Salmonella enterica]EBH6869927.1 hypothetical protein [Salmonella enterica]EBH6874490.1 hypothetical protein [Salmonella enterica]EBU2896338.1 hypothetical protein [Salmonella enterica]EBU2914482.1 hypothetical protein [Salmonella enterica]
MSGKTNLKEVKTEFNTNENDEFDVFNDVWAVVGDYTIKADGIYEFSEKTQKKIHGLGIIPLSVVKAVREDGKTDYTMIKVRYKAVSTDIFGNPEIEEVEIPLHDFNSLSTDYLRNWSQPVAQYDKQTVVKLMQEIIFNPREYKIPTQKAYTYCGWVSELDKEGIVRWKHIRPNSDSFSTKATDNEIVNNTETAGSEEVFKKTQVSMMKLSRLYTYLCCVAFGAYAKGLLPRSADYSPFVYIHGDYGTGKTTSLFGLGALQGRPEKAKTVFDSKSSTIGLSRLLPWFKHGPFFLDEIDKFMKDRDGMENIMMFCNNGGRIVSGKNGGVLFQQTWDSPIISTGNIDILNHPTFKNDGKSAAVSSRFEFHEIKDKDLNSFGYETQEDKDLVRSFLSTLKRNYGFAYPAIIKTLSDSEYEAEKKRLAGDTLAKNEFQQVYDDFFVEIQSDEKLRRLDEENRISEHIAFSRVGAELMRHYFGDEVYKLALDAVNIQINKYKSGEEEEESALSYKQLSALDRYSEILNFIVNNKSNFIWSDYAFEEGMNDKGQKDKAKAISKSARENNTITVYGEIQVKRLMNDEYDLEGIAFLNADAEKVLGNLTNQLKQDLQLLDLIIDEKASITAGKRNYLGSRALKVKLIHPEAYKREHLSKISKGKEIEPKEPSMKDMYGNLTQEQLIKNNDIPIEYIELDELNENYFSNW